MCNHPLLRLWIYWILLFWYSFLLISWLVLGIMLELIVNNIVIKHGLLCRIYRISLLSVYIVIPTIGPQWQWLQWAMEILPHRMCMKFCVQSLWCSELVSYSPTQSMQSEIFLTILIPRSLISKRNCSSLIHTWIRIMFR